MVGLPISPREALEPYNASGQAREIDAGELQAILMMLATTISDGSIWVETEAELQTITPAAGKYPGGRVTKDPDPEKNGDWVYRHDLEQWVWVSGFPDTMARLINVGGTGDNITADLATSINPAIVTTILFTPIANNPGPVELEIGTADPVSILSPTGTPLGENALIAGVPTWLSPDGDNWRIAFPSNMVAQVQTYLAAALVAQEGAETAQGIAVSAAASAADKVSKSGDTMTGALVLSGDPTDDLHPVTLQFFNANSGAGSVTGGGSIYVSKSELEAAEVAAATKTVQVAFAVKNGSIAGMFERVDSEPSHLAKIRSTDRFISDGSPDATNGGWWENKNIEVIPQFCGCSIGEETVDDTAAIQGCYDLGRTVFVPTPVTAYKITGTLILKTQGQIIRFENMRETLIRNSTTSAPLLYVGDPNAVDGYAQAVELINANLEGNALTTSGFTIWGKEAVNAETGVSWNSSSRNCTIKNLNVNEVGAGKAIRIYSWENSFIGTRLYSNNYQGILAEWEAQANAFFDTYITDCDQESIILGSNGICRLNTFVKTVAQQSGGTNGCIDIDGENNSFDGLYSEANNSKSSPCFVYVQSAATTTNIENLTHLSGGAIVIKDDGNNTKMKNILSNSNLTAAIVKLETNSSKAVLENIDHAIGTTVPDIIWDNSTDQNATLIGSRTGFSTGFVQDTYHASDATGSGCILNDDGSADFARNNGVVLFLNRQGSDGAVAYINQAGSNEGQITVSGTTVSYVGGHLARFFQFKGRKPKKIYKGTVMSNTDEMCSWTVKRKNPKNRKKLIEVTEDNEQLNKLEVSAEAGDTNVAGLYVAEAFDKDGPMDHLLAMTGDFVVRVQTGVHIARGDLLESAGDGTARPQTGDLAGVVQSGTIAKITSATPTRTDPDGMIVYPCVVMGC
ncbi:hypothetical protein [uncultured Cohaesibacter sp.]|uniref:hypothetical protein n=1 Tax=uncultured Cohaesibacter sp. TaxID=1002546 RepID=UPI0029C7AC4B|nr:hypothetical protein [uncultured Cohaesibacter sp.]